MKTLVLNTAVGLGIFAAGAMLATVVASIILRRRHPHWTWQHHGWTHGFLARAEARR